MEVNNYELMIVAKSDKGDSLVNRVEKAIKGNGVKEIKIENLGKKTLAYPIKRNTDASYFVLNFEASSDSVIPISQMLRLEQEDLLRYLIIKRQEKELKVRGKKVFKEGTSEEAKPKVTVAVKQTSPVKSTPAKKLVKKEGKSSSNKKTKVAKGKSKK